MKSLKKLLLKKLKDLVKIHLAVGFLDGLLGQFLQGHALGLLDNLLGLGQVSGGTAAGVAAGAGRGAAAGRGAGVSAGHKRQGQGSGPVSYTHLDVYKRQGQASPPLLSDGVGGG